MKSVEVVELPKDRNGGHLHIGDEVLVYRREEPIGQGEVIDGWVYLTLREIVEAIGCAEDPHPAKWMFRLADLIDSEGDEDDTD